MKVNTQGASISTPFPRALYPGNYFYLIPSSFPFLWQEPRSQIFPLLL